MRVALLVMMRRIFYVRMDMARIWRRYDTRTAFIDGLGMILCTCCTSARNANVRFIDGIESAALRTAHPVKLHVPMLWI